MVTKKFPISNEPPKVLSRDALCQRVELGMLYDERTNQLLGGMSLWSQSIIDQNSVKTKKSDLNEVLECKFEFHTSEKDRLTKNGVDGTGKLSLEVGLGVGGGELEGSYRQESNLNTKTQTVTVVCTVAAQVRSIDSSLYQLVENQHLLAHNAATHFVAEVTEGGYARLKLTQEAEDNSEKSKIEAKGKLQYVSKKLKQAADNANTTAGNANTTADNAITTAGNANTTAGKANTTAGKANTTAGKAITTAGKANKTDDKAITTAGKAIKTDDKAIKTDDKAIKTDDKAIEDSSESSHTAQPDQESTKSNQKAPEESSGANETTVNSDTEKETRWSVGISGDFTKTNEFAEKSNSMQIEYNGSAVLTITSIEDAMKMVPRLPHLLKKHTQPIRYKLLPLSFLKGAGEIPKVPKMKESDSTRVVKVLKDCNEMEMKLSELSEDPIYDHFDKLRENIMEFSDAFSIILMEFKEKINDHMKGIKLEEELSSSLKTIADALVVATKFHKYRYEQLNMLKSMIDGLSRENLVSYLISDKRTSPVCTTEARIVLCTSPEIEIEWLQYLKGEINLVPFLEWYEDRDPSFDLSNLDELKEIQNFNESMKNQITVTYGLTDARKAFEIDETDFKKLKPASKVRFGSLLLDYRGKMIFIDNIKTLLSLQAGLPPKPTVTSVDKGIRVDFVNNGKFQHLGGVHGYTLQITDDKEKTIEKFVDGDSYTHRVKEDSNYTFSVAYHTILGKTGFSEKVDSQNSEFSE